MPPRRQRAGSWASVGHYARDGHGPCRRSPDRLRAEGRRPAARAPARIRRRPAHVAGADRGPLRRVHRGRVGRAGLRRLIGSARGRFHSRTSRTALPRSSRRWASSERTCSGCRSAEGSPSSCTAGIPTSPMTLVLASAYAGWAGSLPSEVVEQRLTAGAAARRHGPRPAGGRAGPDDVHRLGARRARRGIRREHARVPPGRPSCECARLRRGRPSRRPPARGRADPAAVRRPGRARARRTWRTRFTPGSPGRSWW